MMAEGSSRQCGGNDDSLKETPKKKCKREQAPEYGEHETVKNCKRVQSELKTILEKSSQKLLESLPKFSQPGAREGILYLGNRIKSLKPDILMDPIYIGLFGSTGAGKSTLLNAIVDKKYFLPVSGCSVCTSCVVQVNTSRSKQHEAKIHLLTDEEWKDELKGLVELVDPSEDNKDNSEGSEAALKISAIYGKGAETKSYEELCRMKPVVSIQPSRCITFREATAEELSEKMCPYIRNLTSAGGEMREEDRKMQLWPLVKNVEVTLPYSQVIPEGVVFVDIPGTGDFNSKRDEMWKENINKCSIIWVVNSIQRIMGDKIHEMLLREGMKAFQCGMCRDISLVVTKSDDLNLDEYRWEKKKKTISKHDAILEMNEAVKQEKSRTIKKKLEEKLPNDLEVVHKADLVYTVSAREYWHGETLSEEETEIPKLRDYIRKFYVEQKRNMLMDHTMEAFTIFSLIRSLQANKHAQYQLAKRNHLRDVLVQKIADLGKDIKECFLPIEQLLGEGVEEAKKSYETALRSILSRNHGYQGYHRTLRAVCLKKGVYASRTFYRIDINSSLAQPIYEKIDKSFGNVFGIQMGTCSTLKACLNAFKEAMQQKLQDAQIKLMADNEHKLAFLKQETDFIVSEAEKLILQRKASVYQSLVVSIQNDLLVCYEEAAAVRGLQAYQKMQNILSKGVTRAVESGMFNRAENSMREHLQDMREQITRKLEEDFSNMLSLAFCPWDQLDGKLPDLHNEYLHISFIHKTLQSAKTS